MLFYYWLLLILPLSAHPFWGQKLGPFTPFEYLGAVCLGYAVNHAAFRRKRIISILAMPAMRLCLVLYLILVVSALTKGTGVGMNDQALVIYTSSLLLVIITVLVVDTMERLRWTMFTLISSYAFSSLYVIREWQHGHELYSNFRPGWIVGDSNYFATTAIFALALAFYFLQEKRRRLERLYWLGCLLLTLLAVTLCASRGGFIGLIVAVVYLSAHTKNGVRNMLAMAVLILPLGVLLPMSPLHRILRPEEDHGSTESHLTAWKAGLRMIETHPIVGIGLGNFKPLIEQYEEPDSTVRNVAHNMYIEIAAELGIPALCIFLAILGLFWRTLRRIYRSNAVPELVRGSALALQAGLIGFAVAGAFVSAEYQKTSWTGLAVIASLESLAAGMERAKASTRKKTSEMVSADLSRLLLQG